VRWRNYWYTARPRLCPARIAADGGIYNRQGLVSQGNAPAFRSGSVIDDRGIGNGRALPGVNTPAKACRLVVHNQALVDGR